MGVAKIGNEGTRLGKDAHSGDMDVHGIVGNEWELSSSEMNWIRKDLS